MDIKPSSDPVAIILLFEERAVTDEFESLFL